MVVFCRRVFSLCVCVWRAWRQEQEAKKTDVTRKRGVWSPEGRGIRDQNLRNLKSGVPPFKELCDHKVAFFGGSLFCYSVHTIGSNRNSACGTQERDLWKEAVPTTWEELKRVRSARCFHWFKRREESRTCLTFSSKKESARDPVSASLSSRKNETKETSRDGSLTRSKEREREERREQYPGQAGLSPHFTHTHFTVQSVHTVQTPEHCLLPFFLSLISLPSTFFAAFLFACCI